MSQHHIITYNQDIKQSGRRFIENKTKISEIMQTMSNRINKKTEKERRDVEDAIKRYQKKVDALTKEKEFLEYEDKIESLGKEMKQFAQEAFHYYQREVQNIENQNISVEEKNKAKKSLINFIMNHFATDKEKKFFEELMRGGHLVMMLPEF